MDDHTKGLEVLLAPIQWADNISKAIWGNAAMQELIKQIDDFFRPLDAAVNGWLWQIFVGTPARYAGFQLPNPFGPGYWSDDKPVFGRGGTTPYSGSANDVGASGRALGGPVWKDHAYIVGERGPEPFIPRSDGYILPNSSLAGDLIDYERLAQAMAAAMPQPRGPITIGPVNITGGDAKSVELGILSALRATGGE
jgi:hypothetical protein